MKRFATAGVAVLMFGGFMSGCCNAPKDATSLVGTWSGESTSATTKFGFGTGKRTIVVKDVSGTEFIGENTFTFKAAGPINDPKFKNSYDKDAGTITGSKPIAGTYDPKTGVVTIAEGDTGGGVMKGKFIDKDTLVIEYAQPGEWARVFRATLKRQVAEKK